MCLYRDDLDALHTSQHLVKRLNEVSQTTWNGVSLRSATSYFFVNSETCSNEPTQQGALPLHGERRGTLTARPWCWIGAPSGGRADATRWRQAAAGSRSARAPRPACRRPGWFSCGPLRTWPPGTGRQPPDRKWRGKIILYFILN